MIIVVFGLPGSGKSYFAARLAKTIGAVYINSDRLRRELFDKRRYTKAEKAKVYEAMIQKMEEASDRNNNVVLDATFHKKQTRDLISEHGKHEVSFIEICAEEAVIKQRLEKDRPFSEADFKVYQLIKKEWEPMEEQHLILNSTDENLEMMLKKARQYLNNEPGTT